MLKRGVLIIVLLSVFLISSACNNIHKTSQQDAIDISFYEDINVDNQGNNEINEEEMEQFLTQFITSIKAHDGEAFKELISGDGLFSITYFVEQRDHHGIFYFKKESIKDGVSFIVPDGRSVSVSTMFGVRYPNKFSKVSVHTSEYLSSISFGIDWHSSSESVVEERLGDIVDTLEKIILVNNEYTPQIFVLKDHIYAFTESDYGGENDPTILGDWVIFEKTEEGYHILAVMDFQ